MLLQCTPQCSWSVENSRARAETSSWCVLLGFGAGSRMVPLRRPICPVRTAPVDLRNCMLKRVQNKVQQLGRNAYRKSYREFWRSCIPPLDHRPSQSDWFLIFYLSGIRSRPVGFGSIFAGFFWPRRTVHYIFCPGRAAYYTPCVLNKKILNKK